jgi:hypothetical protein
MATAVQKFKISNESFPYLRANFPPAALIEFRHPALGLASDSLSGFYYN